MGEDVANVPKFRPFQRESRLTAKAEGFIYRTADLWDPYLGIGLTKAQGLLYRDAYSKLDNALKRSLLYGAPAERVEEAWREILSLARELCSPEYLETFEGVHSNSLLSLRETIAFLRGRDARELVFVRHFNHLFSRLIPNFREADFVILGHREVKYEANISVGAEQMLYLLMKTRDRYLSDSTEVNLQCYSETLAIFIRLAELPESLRDELTDELLVEFLWLKEATGNERKQSPGGNIH